MKTLAIRLYYLLIPQLNSQTVVILQQQQQQEEMAGQGKQKVACTDTKVKMNAMENELSKIVGLDELKIQVGKWFKGMLLDERRQALGLSVAPRRLPHFAFLGNPGTGKTMVARVLGKLLHMVGILPKDKVTEVQRSDLVGQYVGQTGQKTRAKITEADGGILFVDEAYRLVPEKLSYNDFGKEALEEIMCSMDKEKIVVIFAGYTEPMKRVLCSNEGMQRRVSNIFHFDDFSCEQLAQMVHLKLPNKDKNSPFYGFKLDPRGTSVKDIAALIEGGTSAEQRRKMNGGLVDQMLVKARENLDLRIDMECTDEYAMVAITSEDLVVGLGLLRGEEKSGKHHQMMKKGEELKENKLGVEMKLQDPEPEVDIGDIISVIGIMDAVLYVKKNLPGTDLDFLRKGFEKYMNEFPRSKDPVSVASNTKSKAPPVPVPVPVTKEYNLRSNSRTLR